MKKLVYMFLVLFVASCGSDKTASISTDASRGVSSARITVQSVLSNMEQGKYKEGELLVKFKSGVLSSSSVRSHQSLGASVMRTYSLVPNLEHVKLPEGLSVRDAVISYMSDPDVEYAEPNYILTLDSASAPVNDMYFGQQWALRNAGQFADGIVGADIKVPEVWALDSSDLGRNSNVIIAVLDSGIDYNHPDLSPKIWMNPGEVANNSIDEDHNGKIDDWRGWNFVNNNNDAMDDLGHGTHISGIIGAARNNVTGVSGMLGNIKIMPLKIGDANGNGFTVAIETAAIQYAASKGARVINASYHLNGYSNAEASAIQNSGILFVNAAGNDAANLDFSPRYPQNYNLSNKIVVAATDQTDRLATFSDFGPNTVHVAAPGVYVLSTVPEAGIQGSFISMCTNSFVAGYDFCMGTSMAAPHVTALAGMLYSFYPNFNLDQVKATILRYVDRESDGYAGLHSLKGMIQTEGRINAYRAVSSLLSPSALVATATSPNTVSLTWTDNATGEDGYRIERSVSGGPFAQIGTIGPNGTVTAAFADAGLQPTTTYVYRVRAFNNIGESPLMSNEASVTTPAVEVVVPTTGSGGGGGCSIGARQNSASAAGNAAVMLIPLVVVFLMRRKKK
ncbi:MAG: S8 family serine peptidase [Nitrospirae bacterium]|nr:S8 family serine peptidase [Nitrospirota bacterium]